MHKSVSTNAPVREYKCGTIVECPTFEVFEPFEPFLKPGMSMSRLTKFMAFSYAFFTSGGGRVTVIVMCDRGCGSALTSMAYPDRLPLAALAAPAAHRACRTAPDLCACSIDKVRFSSQHIGTMSLSTAEIAPRHAPETTSSACHCALGQQSDVC